MSINPYNMGKPTERELDASLEKLMGPTKAKEIMTEAREYCGTYNPDDTLVRLTEMATWLSKRKGLASVVGRSMLIRIKFYESIYRKYEYA
jgi:hypothetical protein